MNSILNNISNKSLVANIRLKISNHAQDNMMLIVVEGKSDKKVYQKFYDKKCFDVVQSDSGSGQFVDLFEQLNNKYSNKFIVIKDADFDRLNAKKYDFPNLFLTDTHDLETMMLTKDFYDAINKKYEISNANKLIKEAICDIIHLSYIRWMNDVQGTRFQCNIRVASCYVGTQRVEIQTWIDYIRQLGDNKSKAQINLLTEENVRAFEETNPIDAHNLLQLTNGHNLVEAIERKLSATKNNSNIGIKTVEDLLSSEYSEGEYKKTNLYSEIVNWLKLVGFKC